MRLFRLVVVLATLVTLPGYGLAATGHAGGCPERAAGAPLAMAVAAMDMSAMDMSTMDMGGLGLAATHVHGAATQHDCCPGASGQPKPASTPHPDCPACVAGHACKSSPGAQTLVLRALRLLPLHAAAIDEPSLQASQCGPDGLLRPPNRS